MSCENIPSISDLEKTKLHADDFGRLMGTGTGTSTNGVTGQVRPTYNKVISDIGFKPASFTFVTGGTLTQSDYNKAVYNPAPNGDDNWYAWAGAMPKTIAPNSTPQTSGGFGPSGWIPKTDVILKPSVLEAIRRSYAETGYTQVAGSFEQGGILTSASDVLLHEASGKGYSGAGPFPQTVPADTNPSTGGFTDRSLIRPGAGVIRDGRFALRDILCASDFTVEGNGTDERVNIQKAIDYASSLGGITELLFEPGKTYVTSGLAPKSGVLIDMQGSTLKLSNNANAPVFFDGGAGNGTQFGVINGTLDCNQVNNAAINVIGGIWLTGWSRLRFENLFVINCLRIGLNLNACNYINIDWYRFKDSGLSASGQFAYGLIIDKGAGVSRFISVKNVEMSDIYGFGVHFYGCADYYANNLGFFNLVYGTSQAIAITFTQTQRGICNNVIANKVSGDSIEINGCEDLTLENYKIIESGNRALLTGSSTYGDNKRLRIRNFTDTGTVGAFSAALNNLIDCEFDGVMFAKKVSTVAGQTSMRRNIIRNSTIGDTVSNNPVFTAYEYFKMDNVAFTDYTFRQFNAQGAVVSGYQSPVANGAAINLPIAAIFGTTLISSQGAISGTLKTMCRFTGAFAQGSYQTCSFLVNDAGTAANLSTIVQVNNASARTLTITGDAANKRIVLTNGSGVDLGVSWTLEATFFN